MTSGLLTRARVDQIRAELDAAGEQLAGDCGVDARVVEVRAGDHRYRDPVVLSRTHCRLPW